MKLINRFWLTACPKINLSIKKRQAARACSFIFRQALIGFIALGLNACYGHYSTSPYMAVLTIDTGQHLRSNTNTKTLGSAKLEKKGEDCIENFLLLNTLYHSGNPSIKKAMANAGITKIAVVDHYSTEIFPIYTLYSKDCIVVWGE
ncbi:MAG: hypothetical protein H7A25_14425 [Leptospiraceae bacterium]|nr:hypothetical protein [Leptospiraceae bacterium]MCP5501100.1 hypothetical protein [Leptospiraceae bacterium]